MLIERMQRVILSHTPNDGLCTWRWKESMQHVIVSHTPRTRVVNKSKVIMFFFNLLNDESIVQ